MAYTLRNILLASATFITAVSLSSCVTESDGPTTEYVRTGDRLPLFTATMNDGTTIDTDSLRGQQSMIVFFNTDCADCRRELPIVEEYSQKYHLQTRIICISRSQSQSEIERYWKEHSLTLPFSAQNDSKIFNMFATSGIPRIYISDPDLTVTDVFTDRNMASLSDLELATGVAETY